MQLGYDLVGSYDWSYIFDCQESARKNEDLNLANYCVSQATLEDVSNIEFIVYGGHLFYYRFFCTLLKSKRMISDVHR